jgi:PAS domain S-box-containing protein
VLELQKTHAIPATLPVPKEKSLVTLLFVAAAGLLAASIIFVYQVGLLRIRAEQKTASHLLVLQDLSDFLSLLKDAETGQRGFLLTGEESYLQPYNTARSQTQSELDDLNQLASSGQLLQQEVQKLSALAHDKLTELDQTIALRRANGPDAALAVVRSNNGKQLMDDLRTHVGQMHIREEAELADSRRAAARYNDTRTTAFIVAAVLNLAFLAWAFHKISREMAQRSAVTRDITHQRGLLATTLASIGDAVMATDEKGQVTFLNPEAEHLTGWKLSEAAGQPLSSVFRIVNESTRQPVDNPVDKVIASGGVVGLANHTLLIARDGTETPIDDSAAPIREPQGLLSGIILVFRDASAQRKAQAASAHLAAIVRHSGDAIITKNLNGIIQSWNEGAERLFGYKPEEIIGQPILRLIPRDRFEEEEQILATIRQGLPYERLETVRVAKDGRHISVSLRISPLKNAQGEVVGASKIIHDITDRKRAEHDLREVHAQLADRAIHLETLVSDRTSQLREMVTELQHVSYAIVHDMRAPLRAMSAFSDAIREHLAAVPNTPPQLMDYCKRIATAAARLDKLIQDSLNYTKTILQEVPVKPVDLANLIPSLIQTYPNLQPDKADIKIESPLPVVLGDESLLTQCFSNLLGNAVKFVPRGVRPEVQVRSAATNGYTRVTVQDNGIGIEPKAQERIFGMFQRLTAEYEGTGIGLAIVRKVAERMGGKVGVESAPGRGSSFWVDLRLATPTPHSEPQTPA